MRMGAFFGACEETIPSFVMSLPRNSTVTRTGSGGFTPETQQCLSALLRHEVSSFIDFRESPGL
jgi:hypothetical protein